MNNKVQKKHNNNRNLYRIVLLILIVFNFGNASAQKISLFGLGKKMIEIAKSDTPEKILDLVNVGEDLDKKAAILESFLATKTTMENLDNIKNYKLFNVIKENDSLVYFLIKNNKKFYVVSSILNARNQIVGKFKYVKSKISKKLEAGEKVYKSRCYSCHGINGKGGLGSNLTDQYCKFVHSDEDMIDIIANGKKGTMMIAYKTYLSPEEIEAVATYVKSLRGIEVKNGKSAEGKIDNPNLKIFNK
jgi:mono/diheme cytochrome c family protein